MGNPKASRAVGNLLNKNPDPEKYPCFKIVKSSGEIAGFAMGAEEKIRRLEKEGIQVEKGRISEIQI